MRRPRQLRLWLSLAAVVVMVLLSCVSMFTSVSRQSTSDATAAELASTPPFRRFILSNVENDAAATVSTYSVNDAYSMNDLRDGLDGQLRTVRVHAPTRAAGAGLAAPSCCERISVAEGAADVFLSDDLNACPSRDD